MGLLERYEGETKGLLSDVTRARYLQVLRSFIRVVGEKTAYDAGDVERYLRYLEQGGKGSNYRRWVFFVLRSFYDVMGFQWWSRKEERRFRPRAEDPKMPYLRQKEMKRMLEAVDSKPPMIRALVRISTLSPIRRVELQRLNREDYQKPFLRIKTRKKGEARTLTLDEETCKALDEYLASRQDGNPELFTSRIVRRVSLPTLTLMYRDLLEELGLYRRGLGWHGARRGVTTMLYKAGIQERELQQYGGWRSRDMPSRYIQLEGPEIEEKVKQRHPLIRR